MKRGFRVLIVVAALLALGVPAAAQSVDPELAKLADQYQAAYNKGDAKTIAAMYTADALRVNPGGQLVVGRAAIEKEYATGFAGMLKGSKVMLRQNRSQLVKPDVALLEGTFESSGGTMPVKGRYVNTLVREGGQWKLASVVTIPETAAGPAAAPPKK